MHKVYRELQTLVQQNVAAFPEAKRVVEGIGELDDLDPLRVPAIKAMKRIPAPPLRLVFEVHGDELVLYARNLSRKRKPQSLPCCAAAYCPAWMFDTEASMPPGIEPELHLNMLRMVKESFSLLGTRIGIYFPASFAQELIINENPRPHFTIAQVPLGQ